MHDIVFVGLLTLGVAFVLVLVADSASTILETVRSKRRRAEDRNS